MELGSLGKLVLATQSVENEICKTSSVCSSSVTMRYELVILICARTRAVGRLVFFRSTSFTEVKLGQLQHSERAVQAYHFAQRLNEFQRLDSEPSGFV